ncbi:ATP-binding protein [Cryobacterium sp. TMT3-29-2]|uniref:ATP-binding protein n=1 Tax=Cryobacterium TaxID=69578 RepID=UPI0035127D3C
MIRAVVEESTTAGQKEPLNSQRYLAELLVAECDARDRRSSVRRVKAAGFPRDTLLGDFDFNFHRKRREQQHRERIQRILPRMDEDLL